METVFFQQLKKTVLISSSPAFRQHHSTETTRVKVLNDIYLNTDNSRTSVLFQDLSAAFETVDHDILLDRLKVWVGLSGAALNWFECYLNTSEVTRMTCGVPQCSILGPLLFNIYLLPLAQMMKNNKVCYHSNADETQIYITISLGDDNPIQGLSKCIEEINNWMCQNLLKLNTDKTEVIVFAPKNERSKVSGQLQSLMLKTTNQDRNLGVVMDSDLNLNSQIKTITKLA